MAFVRWKDADSALYTADVNGTSVELLTRIEKMQIQFPRWSPDGTRIVATKLWVGNAVNIDSVVIVDLKTKEKLWFKSTWPTLRFAFRNQFLGLPRSSTAVGLAISRMAGTVVLQDIDNKNIRNLFWFPSCGDVLEKLDERSVLLQSSSMRQNLRQIDVDETDFGRWFTRGSSMDRQPVYSRDGKSILFSSFGTGTLDLMQVTLETGAVTRVTEDAADDWDPYYTPDGNHILWSANRDGHFEIWMANPDAAIQGDQHEDSCGNPTMTQRRWIGTTRTIPKKMSVENSFPMERSDQIGFRT